MARKTKAQAKKAKARERKIHKQKVENRLFAARKARSEREAQKEAQAAEEKIQPIRRSSETQLQKIQAHLDRNIEILKSIEEEYRRDLANRENLHQQLEAEGFNTVEEKLEALKQKSIEMAEKLQENLIAEREREEFSKAENEIVLPTKTRKKK